MTKSVEGRVQLVVVGGGPGGYAAAFAAADRGMDVSLVDEAAKPGGVCLYRGCIPSKALLHVAKLIHEVRQAAEWGISFDSLKIDLDQLRAFKQSVVEKLTEGAGELSRLRGVKLIQARGRFLDSNSLQLTTVDGRIEELRFERAILATGSSPVMPAMFDLGDSRIMDSTDALELPEIPERLLVIGGGYIGLELGSVYAALGSRVTVVEMTSSLLPAADRELVRPLKKSLDQQFEAIHLNTRVKKLTSDPRGILGEFEGADIEDEQTFDRVLVAVGRRPNTSNLGLENTNVEVDDRGFVKVDRQRWTSDPNIMAIGDLAGEPMLAHKAAREAKVAVEVLDGEETEFNNLAIPAVVFTDPELAWCGMTDVEAKTSGRKVKSVRFPWGASGRAQTIGRTEGLTKLLFDPETERVLGMGIVGSGAGELIAEGVLAIEMGASVRDIAHSIHAHPTLSETIMEAAEAAFGQATHLYRKRL